MNDDTTKPDSQGPADEDLIEIDLNFASMRRFQAEFSQNLATDGLFIDTAEPLEPGSVVRFRVVLPEDFVFLEGTAVVEWVRRPEDGAAGPTGMALRFVTMSPQNQELVEQLVSDHVEAGGEPFDLDVRPVPTDFPTDALEAPPDAAAEPDDEAFRLTVRGTGPRTAEEALRALAEASPEEADSPDPETPSDPTPPPFRAEAISDPPELDLGDDDEEAAADDADSAPVEPPDEEAAEQDGPGAEAEADPAASGFDADDAASDEGSEAVADCPRAEDVTLPDPEDFADGPEVIDEVGGSAFDVSLPEPDDEEPDTTPVLPDEGTADVTVPSDDEPEPPAPRRARWWLAAAAIVVAAAAAGAVVFWPRIGPLLPDVDGGHGPVAEGVAEDGALPPVEPAAGPDSQLPAADQPTDGAGVDGEPDEAADPTAADQVPGAAQEEPSDGGAETVADQPTSAGIAAGEQDPAAPAAAAEESAAATGDPTDVAETVEPAVEPTPARVITELAVEPGSGATVVRLRGDGSLEDGAISVETLRTPPRILVRVRGIESGYRPYIIDAATPEVSRVRVGHHVDRNPPELWVVLDLTGTDVALDGVDLEGGTARIAVSRP